ncbi:MAG: alpha/beta fold hydrolase [Gaiellaceae bacterium]
MLLHAGVGDRRLWDEQMDAFAERFRVVRYDARGFGDSPLPGGPFSFVDDLCAILDHLRLERAALVGNSLGARTALEHALAHAERTSALVLVGAPPMGAPSSAELEAFDTEEDALLEAGKVDEAVELNLRTWLADDVEPALRARVGEMQRRAFELQLAAYSREPEPGPVGWLDDPPVWESLGDVGCPTLILVGDRDVSDMDVVADRLAVGIAGARKVVMPGTAHVPAFERPEDFNRIVLEFLAGVFGPQATGSS